MIVYLVWFQRYQIVFRMKKHLLLDSLLGEGVTYETAGSLNGGKRVWMLARLEGRILPVRRLIRIWYLRIVMMEKDL